MARPARAASASSSCSRTSGPGTERLSELGPGDGLHVTGPLGLGFTGPPHDRAAARCCAAAGVGTAPLAIWQDELLARGEPAPALLGFRDAEHAPGAALLHNARIATDDGSHGHHGLVTDLLAAELDADAHAVVYACGPPPMLEAVRALCAERGVPCQLALESGMACGFGACFGCVVPLRAGGYLRLCVDGPVLDGALLEVPRIPVHTPRARDPARGARGPDGGRPGLLRPAPRPPDHQRVGHLRRDRRPPGVRRRADRALPVRGLRLQDDHARAARRQPAAAPVRDAGRHDQLDRPAQQGPRRATSSTTCPSSRGCRCRSSRTSWARRRRSCARWSRRSTTATRSPRSSSTSPAQRQHGARHRRRPHRARRRDAPGAPAHRQAAHRQAHAQHRRRRGRRAGRPGGGRRRRVADQHAARLCTAPANSHRPAHRVAGQRDRRAVGPRDPRGGPRAGPRGGRARLDPVVGMGGVQRGLHAAHMLEAGATLVAVGTESFRDPAAGTRISRELDDLFAKSGDKLG